MQIEGQIHSEGQITVRVPSEERVKGQTPSDRLITVPVPSEGPWAGRVPSEAVPPHCGSCGGRGWRRQCLFAAARGPSAGLPPARLRAGPAGSGER